MKKAILYIFAFLAIQFVAQFLVVTAYVLVTRQPIEAMPPLWNIATMVLFSVSLTFVFFERLTARGLPRAGHLFDSIDARLVACWTGTEAASEVPE